MAIGTIMCVAIALLNAIRYRPDSSARLCVRCRVSARPFCAFLAESSQGLWRRKEGLRPSWAISSLQRESLLQEAQQSPKRDLEALEKDTTRSRRSYRRQVASCQRDHTRADASRMIYRI